MSVQQPANAVVNAITVDVEDWVQSALDPTMPLTELYIGNTRRVLESFAAKGVTGTFYVLGLVADKSPELVREIQAAGHEVQSHGYGHELVHLLTPESFRADLDRSKKQLEDLTGRAITGYRAPAFSITRRNLWALDVLVEAGFEVDSSVFPIEMGRYGIAGAPWYPHKIRTPLGYELTEIPVGTWRVCGHRWPVGGGGYFRLFPYGVIRRCVRQLNVGGHPAVVYMHPYEYNPGEFSQLDISVSWKMRLHQGLGRGGFAGKVDRMLSEFRFGRMRDVVASLGALVTHEHRPL